MKEKFKILRNLAQKPLRQFNWKLLWFVFLSRFFFLASPPSTKRQEKLWKQRSERFYWSFFSFHRSLHRRKKTRLFSEWNLFFFFALILYSKYRITMRKCFIQVFFLFVQMNKDILLENVIYFFSSLRYTISSVKHNSANVNKESGKRKKMDFFNIILFFWYGSISTTITFGAITWKWS